VAIISIFLEFFYDTSKYPDWENWVYAMGDLTGYGLHGDFVNGWADVEALGNAFQTCSGGGLSMNSPVCSITKGVVQGSVEYEPEGGKPDENVGLNGPLKALPGDNKVTGSANDRIN
jgi:hypothetical protein